ncbi:MAG: adhesin, partial [Clostridia bacterium]|nr:adhesin [Clostridia bacterium]
MAKKIISTALALLLCVFSVSLFVAAADNSTYDYEGPLFGVVSADGEEYTSDNEDIISYNADECALLAQNGGILIVQDGKVTKYGDDTDEDNCSFYGINSVALSKGADTILYVADSSLTSAGTGANAVFSTDNANALVYNTTIGSTFDNSRGLDATYSGRILADTLTITTGGAHSAALATDRGGGEISLTNSTLTTSGEGSPLIYSTGDVEVCSVTGSASGSRIAALEGNNTILIHHSEMSSTITAPGGSDPVADGIMIYRSNSGDAESSTDEAATFQAVSSKLSSSIASGAMFY